MNSFFIKKRKNLQTCNHYSFLKICLLDKIKKKRKNDPGHLLKKVKFWVRVVKKMFYQGKYHYFTRMQKTKIFEKVKKIYQDLFLLNISILQLQYIFFFLKSRFFLETTHVVNSVHIVMAVDIEHHWPVTVTLLRKKKFCSVFCSSVFSKFYEKQ